MRRWKLAAGVGCLSAIAACATQGTRHAAVLPPLEPVCASSSASTHVVGTALPDMASRQALFAALLRRVRRVHVFSPITEKNLDHRFGDDVETLEREIVGASTLPALQVGLTHFGNALHDVHCRYRPPASSERFRLPVAFDVEWQKDQPVFYVASVRKDAPIEVRESVHVGDIVTQVDGVLAKDLLATHRLVSNQNHPFTIAQDVATFLGSRRSHESLAREGTETKIVFTPRTDGTAKAVSLPWIARKFSGGSDFDVDYTSQECGFAGPKNYGAYTLTARGARFCLYTAKTSPQREVPIVRAFSFRYLSDEGEHGVLLDHALLKAQLAAIPKLKGVIVDLQDNGGGNNPNLFLDWWAHGSYVDMFTFTRLDPLLSTDTLLREHGANLSTAATRFHLDALSASGLLGKPALADDPTPYPFAPKRPFMCRPDTCMWDNTYKPAHPVTSVPVALIVGPGCASSCDAFAFHFEESRLGPLVGEPTMAGFTTHRIREDLPHGLGSMDFAFSYDVSGKTGEMVEGKPRTLTQRIPRTFANRDVWDRQAAEAARIALSTWTP